MQDIVKILQDYAGNDLTELVRRLEDAPTTQRNILFREFVNRIRKAAGVSPRPDPERGGLLDIAEMEPDNAD